MLAVLQLGTAVNVGLTNSISGRLAITRPLPPARTLPHWIVLSVGIVRAGRLQCGWGGAAPSPLKTTPQAQFVVVSPGMGRCLEKIDDRHLRSDENSFEGPITIPLHNQDIFGAGGPLH